MLNRLQGWWKRLRGKDNTPAPAPVPHDPDCDACAHLERIHYRYKPPEVLLEAGFPLDCLSHKLGMTMAELIALAEQEGMVIKGLPEKA